MAHPDRHDSGAYYKGPALAVPNIAAVRAGILQELHDSNYAGHVGIHRTLFNVKRIYWWPDMARHRCVCSITLRTREPA